MLSTFEKLKKLKRVERGNLARLGISSSAQPRRGAKMDVGIQRPRIITKFPANMESERKEDDENPDSELEVPESSPDFSISDAETPVTALEPETPATICDGPGDQDTSQLETLTEEPCRSETGNQNQIDNEAGTPVENASKKLDVSLLSSKESVSGRKMAVKVAVHVRPLLNTECRNRKVVNCSEEMGFVSVPVSLWGQGPKKFTFDHVYQGGEADDETRDSCSKLYDECVLPLLDGCLDGLNATVLAYGQTGSGKTFTMGTMGGSRGIIPRFAKDLFKRVHQATVESEGRLAYTINVSFFEVYREVLSDLLVAKPPRNGWNTYKEHQANLCIREDHNRQVFVSGLTTIHVNSEDELLQQLDFGCSNRATGSTEMNSTSSRSHAVFTVTVQSVDRRRGFVQTSKFHLVDLAGSERAKKTKAKGSRLAEGIDINLGLLALGNVISALGDEKMSRNGCHIPYRDSKLTRILQDSLGGNSRTCMIACISPAEFNFEETLSTLRYANRAKKIKNKPVKNRSLNLENLVKQLQDQIELLESQLDATTRKLEEEISKNEQILEQSTSPPAADVELDGVRENGRRGSLKSSRSSVLLAEQNREWEQIMDLQRQQHQVELDLLRKDYEDQVSRLEDELEDRVSPSFLSTVGCFSAVKRPHFKMGKFKTNKLKGNFRPPSLFRFTSPIA